MVLMGVWKLPPASRPTVYCLDLWLCRWYHLIVLFVTLTPMLASYPAKAVVPTCHQLMLLVGVSACQFAGQLMLNRGFQLLSATRGSAINVLQVRVMTWHTCFCMPACQVLAW
jgi:hypothetical protein